MRIIIVGKGGAGKDTLRNRLQKRGFKKEISYTTRPPRDGEIDGIDYYFITKEQFESKVSHNEMYEHQCFNGWYYGTSNFEWEENHLFIFTPSGCKDINYQDRKYCTIIYLDIDIETRKKRLLKRNDADKMERRIAADEEDFKNFTDYDIKITNSDF